MPRLAKGPIPPRKSPSRVARSLWPQVAELRAMGRTGKQIADAIGRDTSAVCKTLQEPEVIADIDRLQRDRRAALEQEMRGAAAMAWAEVLRIATESDEGDAVRLRAATDILDRVGIKAPSTIEMSGPGGAPLQVVALRPDDLAQMTPAQLRALATVEEEGEDGQP